MGKRPSEHCSFLTRQQRRFRNFRRWLLGKCALPAAWLLPRLPLSVLKTLGRIPSRILYLRSRTKIEPRLRRALGEGLDRAACRKLIKRSCDNLADSMAEAIYGTHHGVDQVLHGRLDDAAARAKVRALDQRCDRGWIAVTGHIGRWELMPHWLSSTLEMERILVFAKRMPNPHVNKIVEDLRRNLSAATIYQDESPSPAIRRLRNGETIGIVPDQDVKTLSGMFVDFFGKPAYTPVGPARLALAAGGVPILPMFMVREGKRLVVKLSLIHI